MKPTRSYDTETALIARAIARQGSFQSQGKTSYYRAATLMAAADPGLELVDIAPRTLIRQPYIKFGKVVAWGKTNVVSGEWTLKRV